MDSKDLSQTRFYFIWRNLRYRCSKKSYKRKDFKYYYGKGIRNEWKNLSEFADDMYESYQLHIRKFGESNTTIDRINNDGNYCKVNCRWATREEQLKNRNVSFFIIFNNEKITLRDFAKINKLDLNSSTLRSRIMSGWSLERVINEPFHKDKSHGASNR